MNISEARAKTLAQAGSLFLISVAILTLLTWLFRYQPFLRWFPRTPAATCDAALCLLFAGLALFTLQRGIIWLPRIIGLILTSLGTAYSLNFLIGGTFSVHKLFPSYTTSLIVPVPLAHFRIAFGPAVAFLMIGCLLLLISRKHLSTSIIRISVVIAASGTSIGVLGLIASLVGIVSAYWSWSGVLLTMSIPAAVSVCVMGITAQLVLWLKSGATAPQVFSKAAYYAFIGLLLLFASVDATIGMQADEEIKARTDLANAIEKINLIRSTVESVRRAETGQRALLLIGDDVFLQSYRDAAEQSRIDAARLPLEFFSAASPLSATVQAKLDELTQTVNLSRSGQGAEALAIALEDSLRTHLQANQDSLQQIRRGVFLSYLIALSLCSVGLHLLRRENRRRTNVEDELRESALTLEARVAGRTREISAHAAVLKNEVQRRVATEQYLSETVDRLNTSLRLSKTAAWTLDLFTGRATWSGPVADVFARDAPQLASFAEFTQAIHPDDRPSVESAVKDSIRDAVDCAVEFRVVYPNGKIHWLAGVGGVKLDHNGVAVQMAGVNFDISCKKLAEQQLAKSERHFRELAEALPQAIWTSDPNHSITYRNTRWNQLTGLPATHAVTLTSTDIHERKEAEIRLAAK